MAVPIIYLEKYFLNNIITIQKAVFSAVDNKDFLYYLPK